MTILLAPVISEKATLVADKQQPGHLPRRCRDATKQEVKAAVELLFKVEGRGRQRADRQRKGKDKRFGALDRPAQRNWKKAYVCLKPGQEINFAQEAK